MDIITLGLLVIGGLNWGLLGVFDYNLVGELFGGAQSPLARLVYVVVGSSALYQLFTIWNLPRRWHLEKPLRTDFPRETSRVA